MSFFLLFIPIIKFFIEFYNFIFRFKFTIIEIKPLNDLLEDLTFDVDEVYLGYHLQPKRRSFQQWKTAEERDHMKYA